MREIVPGTREILVVTHSIHSTTLALARLLGSARCERTRPKL